ncbi:hypothetical protein GF377_09845 [candidate division GN15 bacterium]|nr:hypothetical protein [candidate division GN15 bacterium]
MTILEEKKQALTDAVDSALTAKGYELADVVLSQFKHNYTVRVFVYGPNGVTIDDCARLSITLGEVIDDLELFSDGYALEVSSPGLDRPLKTARDFRYRVGETVKVRFTEKGRKSITGEIVSANDERVELQLTSARGSKGPKAKHKPAARTETASPDAAAPEDANRVSIDLADIDQASIVF